MSKINVVTALYNTPIKLFEHSLQSLKKASHRLDVKHIVVDDGSTIYDKGANDPELAIVLDGISNTEYIRLETNRGPGAARNEAFKHLDEDCKYICFLDSDDELTPDSLKLRALALDVAIKLNPAVVAVYGNKNTLDIRENKNILTEEIVPEFNINLLRQQCIIPSCSVMFRKDVFLKYIQTMMEDIKMCEDYNLWLKLSSLGLFIKIDSPIYTQVIHGKNLTCTQEVLKNHYSDMVKCFQNFNDWYLNVSKMVN